MNTRLVYMYTAFLDHHTTLVLRPFLRDHPVEPVPEENFWTSWCKGRLTEADTLTIRLGATPTGLTSDHLHHPPIFFTGPMSFLPPNQQRQSIEGKYTAIFKQIAVYVMVKSWRKESSSAPFFKSLVVYEERMRSDHW